MSKTFSWLAIIVLLAGVVAALFILQVDEEQNGPQVVKSKKLELPEASEEPQIQYHVPAEIIPPEPEETSAPVAEEKPLPSLQESDEPIREEFSLLFDQQIFGDLFIFKKFIHRFVVTVDNLTQAKLPQKYRLYNPLQDKFLTNKIYEDSDFIDPNNYQRYRLYVQFTETLDMEKIAPIYIHYYPLFQQAYEDLGYPGRYFNDRLIEVIDHLLQAPEPATPIKLVRPSVYYKFADPELESLSAGQKLLIRIGNDNSNKVKNKLRQLRRTLSSLYDTQ